MRRVGVLERANHEAKAALRTRADAEAYVQSVRERIRECFGPFPERTPLNARITGVIERDAYRIEKIVFESRPGFLVTGNLYLPKGRPLPAPGVIGTCGHSSNGKAAEAYQAFSQGLARLGYVVFGIDPLGQGERLQYVDAALNSRIGVGVREHLHAGNQQFLVGEFLGSWRAWDGIRALDYLETREEVDRRHLRPGYVTAILTTVNIFTEFTPSCLARPPWAGRRATSCRSWNGCAVAGIPKSTWSGWAGDACRPHSPR